MKKRIVVYRNQHLDARRFWVQEMAKKEGLNPPYDSINSKDKATKDILEKIADQYCVNSSCIVSSLQKAKYIPFEKDDFPKEDACWICKFTANTANLEEVRRQKAKKLLEEGWPVNAVNEYLGLSYYSLYKISREIEKSFAYLEKGREGEVFKLWSKGLSQTDVANKLGITRQTVNSDLKKYKIAYIDAFGEEAWEKLESNHNAKCAEGKGTKKRDYTNKAQYWKKEIQNKINEEGSITDSIAEIEKELELNTKTVQKFVLLTLLERNLTERAVEFAIGIVGQPEIIKPALNLFASENEENESYGAVKYVFENHKDLSNQKKKSKNTKLLINKVLKEVSKK